MSTELENELRHLKYEATRLAQHIDSITQKLQDSITQKRKQSADVAVWLNKTQAARYIGVSSRTIRRLEQKGKLSFTPKGRIHIRDIDNYYRSRNKAPHPSP